ncbi:hypothetical protein AJ60_05690 [Pseudomonas aeruginosa 3573]|uniref:hypothetical protein n=1 Tax=Pseudomonas aeruginosa TaxID=287 RepID=UPI0004496CD7|nr:hypothetical protein [Pseudomonas aeruginosa]EZO28627.1 hypothetical protein AJ60_05690 [Pseudomonas aeruginosa 3573]MDO7252205.1 hypothetical protein [Pseudomonas aeruginosa]MDU0668050.1 hypothetical protein [Pseudomonas aeruginosa]MDX4034407.1 hypothetical protein [Pseudomonas aeruginosa]UIN39878.1 hypothetical protein LXN03_21980 [Pseudomonas aeruginosa]
MKNKLSKLKAISLLTLLNSFNAQADVDYGYLYPTMLPNEKSMNDLPYAIPCAEAKNQYGAKFYRCTWYTLPRNITMWNAQQQRDITFSNQISGACKRGTCRASNGSGVYGMYGQDLSFTLSIYYYIYESEDGYPIAYRMDGGPHKKGKEVTYSQARTILQEFLLDHGISPATVADAIAAYRLDANTKLTSSVEASPLLDEKPMSKPPEHVEVKDAWCNPRADDDCTVNGRKVEKAKLQDYLPEVYELEILNAGGYCEHPICYDKNDKPVGIR